jgi:hypothetical protein
MTAARIGPITSNYWIALVPRPTASRSAIMTLSMLISEVSRLILDTAAPDAERSVAAYGSATGTAPEE